MSLEAAAAQLRTRIQSIQDKYKTEQCETLGRAEENLARAANFETGPSVADVVNRLKREHEKTVASVTADYRCRLEAADRRHVERLDELIRDKQELTTVLEETSRRLKSAQHELSSTETRQKQQVQQMRQKLEEQQRQSRLVWEKEKVLEIKELTLKSLEPEVNSLMERKTAQHNEELAALTRRIEVLTGELATANVRFLTEVDRLAADKAQGQTQTLLREERAHSDRELAGLCHKMQIDFAAQLAIAEQRASAAEATVAALQQSKAEDLELEKRKLRLESDLELSQARNQLRADSELLRAQLQHAQTAAVATATAELQTEFEGKLAAVRHTLTAERDAKLRDVVQKLSLDAVETERALRAEMQTERSVWLTAKERLEAQAAEAARAAVNTQTVLAEVKAELRSARFGNEQLQAVLRDAEATVAARKQELRDKQSELEAVCAERASLAEQTAGLESALRRRVDAEEDVIAAIENQLKSVLQSKDEHIAELMSEIELWREKYRHVEQALQQQRMDLLAHLQ